MADAILEKDGIAADVAELDALDEQAVNGYLDDVVGAEGRVDLVFNAIGPQATEYGNATDTVELLLEKFLLPFNTIVASQFDSCRLTSTSFRMQRSSLMSGAGRLQWWSWQ